MNGAAAIARILKQEGIENLSCFPSNPIIEAAAAEGIRPIICRQERAGVNIADGFSRVSNGRRIGVFAMQYGPGAENAYGGVAQAFADSVPILLLPAGYPRDRADTSPNFGAALNYAGVTKWAGQVNSAARIPEMMRRAFSHLRTGRPGPVLLEVPGDVAAEEVDEAALDSPAVAAVRSAGDPHDVAEAARALISAKRPVIHAGQGILYAEATDDLRELAELLQAPVMTTLTGKSAFPEDHPLSLGTGSNTTTGMVHHFLQKADLVFGIGCSFTQTTFGVTIPPGKVMVHSTNDPADVNKDYRTDVAVVGDAKLVLRQVIDEVKRQAGAGVPREDPTPAREIAAVKAEWLQGWMPRLTSDDTPINPYRVVWDLMHTIDRRNSIVTHDSGSPRDQTIPFFEALDSPELPGLGEVHAARVRPGAVHRREAGGAGEAGGQHHGGRRLRHGGAGRGDRRPLPAPHPHDTAEQLDHGGLRGPDAGGDGALRGCTPLRRLRRSGRGARRLQRAGRPARGDRPRHPACAEGDGVGPPGAAGVHHRRGADGVGVRVGGAAPTL